MKTDVLIIGGGLTARRAAALIPKQYSVTLISDGFGASPYIHGLNVPLAEADGTELFLEDTLKSGKEQNNKALARALCEGALSVKEELKDRFDKCSDGSFDLLKPLGSSAPRVAGIDGKTGAVLLSELKNAATYREIANTRALSLIKDGDGVVGAKVFDKTRRVHYSILAHAVLVATGGFGGIFRFSTNSPDIGGDGAAMLYSAGCPMVDMEFIQYEPTVAIAPKPVVGKSIITTMLFEGAVIRNARGERFMDERVGKDALSEGISREILKGGGTPDGGVYYDMTAVPREMLLGKYKDYYNRYKAHGIDVSRESVKIAPAPHTTMGGAVIDEYARTPIDGLFVAGEAAGGIHGANRLGGNAGLEVLVFGDIAGRSIAEFLEKKLNTGATLPELDDSELPDIPYPLGTSREELYAITDRALGVVKCGEELRCALLAVDQIIHKVVDAEGSYEAKRLYNDAMTAKLVITAALARKTSIGSHVRSDSEKSDGERYRFILRKENGDLTVKKEVIV